MCWGKTLGPMKPEKGVPMWDRLVNPLPRGTLLRQVLSAVSTCLLGMPYGVAGVEVMIYQLTQHWTRLWHTVRGRTLDFLPRHD